MASLGPLWVLTLKKGLAMASPGPLWVLTLKKGLAMASLGPLWVLTLKKGLAMASLGPLWVLPLKKGLSSFLPGKLSSTVSHCGGGGATGSPFCLPILLSKTGLLLPWFWSTMYPYSPRQGKAPAAAATHLIMVRWNPLCTSPQPCFLHSTLPFASPRQV